MDTFEIIIIIALIVFAYLLNKIRLELKSRNENNTSQDFFRNMESSVNEIKISVEKIIDPKEIISRENLLEQERTIFRDKRIREEKEREEFKLKKENEIRDLENKLTVLRRELSSCGTKYQLFADRAKEESLSDEARKQWKDKTEKMLKESDRLHSELRETESMLEKAKQELARVVNKNQ